MRPIFLSPPSLLSPSARIQASESALSSPWAAAQAYAALTTLVSEVRKAALNQDAIERLACCITSPAVIRCAPSPCDVTALRNSSVPFAAIAASGYVCTAHAGVAPNDESREAEEQEPHYVSELREQAQDTRDRLRAAHAALENLRANLQYNTAHAHLCRRLSEAWQAAITAMDDVLDSPVNMALAQRLEQLAFDLTEYGTHLKFHFAALGGPTITPGQMPMA